MAFKFEKDKFRCLFADLLAQVMIKEFYNVIAEFSELPLGKPVLSNSLHVCFNVSHSGDWVTCVLDDNEVGIDVEQVKDVHYNISERFFCRKEHECIVSAEDPAQKFFEYWTLKESYVKLIGEGLSKLLNNFCVEFLNGEIRVADNGVLLEGIYFKQFEIEGYKMAVCAQKKEFGRCRIYMVEQIICALQKSC